MYFAIIRDAGRTAGARGAHFPRKWRTRNEKGKKKKREKSPEEEKDFGADGNVVEMVKNGTAAAVYLQNEAVIFDADAGHPAGLGWLIVNRLDQHSRKETMEFTMNATEKQGSGQAKPIARGGSMFLRTASIYTQSEVSRDGMRMKLGGGLLRSGKGQAPISTFLSTRLLNSNGVRDAMTQQKRLGRAEHRTYREIRLARHRLFDVTFPGAVRGGPEQEFVGRAWFGSRGATWRAPRYETCQHTGKKRPQSRSILKDFADHLRRIANESRTLKQDDEAPHRHFEMARPHRRTEKSATRPDAILNFLSNSSPQERGMNQGKRINSLLRNWIPGDEPSKPNAQSAIPIVLSRRRRKFRDQIPRCSVSRPWMRADGGLLEQWCGKARSNTRYFRQPVIPSNDWPWSLPSPVR